MARLRAPIDPLNEGSEVIRLYRKEKLSWKKERLHFIKLLLETNKDYHEVADILGRSRAVTQLWLKSYRERGVKGLLTRGNGGGRKGKLTEKVKEEMVEKLREGAYRTAKQFQAWLEEEHQIRLSTETVYYHLGKLGGRLKTPRPSHIKKDEQAAQVFRDTLAEKLHDLAIAKEKKIKLWVYDEMRYGLHPLLRKMWSLVGTRVVAPVHRRYEWSYLFGAIEIESGESEFLFTEGVNKEFDLAFLEQIARSDEACEHVVIGDGAGFHHKANQSAEALPKNIKVITLPAYSPELNPVEKLWDVVKDKICVKCWESLAEVEEAITEELEKWWQRKRGFSSLLRHSYLRSELNAI